MSRQTTSHLLMIRPVAFTFNPMTAESNAFQQRPPKKTNVQRGALREFDRMVELLSMHGLDVNVVDDRPEAPAPDSIFPNNWIAFFDDTIYLFPMMAPNRRPERRHDLVDQFAIKYGIPKIYDLSAFEAKEQFLEGTGSIVPDRVNKIAYCCHSPRTHPAPLAEFCRLSGYKPHLFEATDSRDRPIYHTNVMMCVGERFSAVCLDSVKNAADRKRLIGSLEESDHELLCLDSDQTNAFAGNMLQVNNSLGHKFIILSGQARKSLKSGQVSLLERHGTLLTADITTIETNGGGSVRCMIAELFVPGN